MEFFDFLGFFIIIALFAWGGIFRSSQVVRKQTYFLADRHTGIFALVATLVMTELNTSTLISFSSAGFFAGSWALSLPLVFLIGLAFYALSVSHKYRETNAMSIAEIFSQKYGSNFGKIVSLCLIAAMIGFSSTYVRSLTLFFSPLLRINSWILSFILVCAVVFFTLRGGLVSIIRTDVISFIAVIIFFPLLLYWTVNFDQSIPKQAISLSQGQELLSPQFVLSLIVLTSFTYILAPWYGQKIFSARDTRVAYLSVAIAAIFVFLFYGITVLSCSVLQQKGVKLTSPEKALPFIFSNIVPLGFRGIFYAVIFMIGATTLAGVWSAMSTMVMVDLLPDSSDDIKWPIIHTLLFAIISFLLANLVVDNVFNKLILANIPVFALSFSLLAAFYWPKVSKLGAYTSTTVGLFWGIFCYLKFGEEGEYTVYWVFAGLPLIFVSGIIFSLLSNKKTVTSY